MGEKNPTAAKPRLDTLRAAIAREEHTEWNQRETFGERSDANRKADSLRDTGLFLLRASCEAVEPEDLHQWLLGQGFGWTGTRGNGMRTYRREDPEDPEEVAAPSSPECRRLTGYGLSVQRTVVGVCASLGHSPYGPLLGLAGDPERWGDGGEAAYRLRIKAAGWDYKQEEKALGLKSGWEETGEDIPELPNRKAMRGAGLWKAANRRRRRAYLRERELNRQDLEKRRADAVP